MWKEEPLVKPRLTFLHKITGFKIQLSIRSFLILSSLALTLVFLLIEGAISYKIAMNVINTRVSEINQKNITSLNSKMSTTFNQVENLFNIANTDETLLQYIQEYQIVFGDAYNRNILQNKIYSIMKEMTFGYEDVAYAAVFTDNESLISSGNEGILDSDNAKGTLLNLYEASNERDNSFTIIDISDQTVIGNRSRFICVSTLGYDEEAIGLLVLIMKNNWPQSILSREENAFILNRDKKTIVYPPQEGLRDHENEIYSQINPLESSGRISGHNGQSVVYYTRMDYSSWTLCVSGNINNLSGMMNRIRVYFFLIFLFSCLLSIFFTSIISRKTVGPILGLSRHIRSMSIEQDVSSPGSTHNAGSIKTISIRDAFMLFYVTVITIPMAIFILLFYLTSSALIENIIRESFLASLQKSTDETDLFFEEIERTSMNIAIDDYVQSFLSDISTKQRELTIDDNILIGKIVDSNLAIGQKSYQVELYDNTCRMVYASINYEKNRLLNSKYQDAISYSFGDPYILYFDKDKNEEESISIFRKIYSIKGDLRLLGYLKITITKNNLKNIYEDTEYIGSEVFIIDTSGLYISCKDKSRIGEASGYTPKEELSEFGSLKVNKDDISYLIAYSECDYVPLILMAEIPYENILRENQTILTTNIYLILVMWLVSFILSYIISMLFSRSFNQMSNELKKMMTSGMTEIRFADHYFFNEMDALSETFNQMASRINTLVQTLTQERIREKELEKEKKETEIVALLAQINPHFLYNTFESIKWMIIKNKEEAASMLTKLGEFLRLGISRKSQFISIEEEINHVKLYVDIQKRRYEENIKVMYTIDDRALGVMIPKLILQPLLENAFIHGFSDHTGHGFINVFCCLEEDMVILKVMDNGEGMDHETKKRIHDQLNGFLSSESVGLYNVQKRIKLFYGDEYGLEVESQQGAGTIISLRLPRS